MVNIPVTGLIYSVHSVGDHPTNYDSAKDMPPFSNEIGEFSIQNKKLEVKFESPYPDEQSALLVVDPFLKKWEVYQDLKQRYGTIRFKFSRPVLDQSEGIAFAERFGFTDHFEFHPVAERYPSPPSHDFKVGETARIAYDRWSLIREGREPLMSGAYCIVTLLEYAATRQENEPDKLPNRERRKAAADKFNISHSLLNEIANLASNLGDDSTRRKFGTGTAAHNSSHDEAWLDSAIRKVVLHLCSLSPTTPQLTIASI